VVRRYFDVEMISNDSDLKKLSAKFRL